MKKIIVIVIVLLLATWVNFAEKQIGEEIGDVLYTDIVTKVNGVNINSFNINGSTAVYVTELRKLGYDVNWNADSRTVEVIDNRDKEIISSDTNGSEGYVPEDQELTVGAAIGKVLHTDIETYLKDTKVKSFNINGSTAIYVDAFTLLGMDFVWDGENRQVLLTREPRKKLRSLENYDQVRFTKLNDEYVLDHTTLPQSIKNEYIGYSRYSSNLFTEEFSDEELFQRSYNPLKETIFIIEGKVIFNPGYSYAYTTITLYNDAKELLGIIQFPRTDRLDAETFELNLYNPKDYDYEGIVADLKNYISDNVENNRAIEDDWIDIINKSDTDDFNFFVNASQIPETLKSESYYVNATNFDKNVFSQFDQEELLTRNLAKNYFEEFNSLAWAYAHPITGNSGTGIDQDSIVLLSLYNENKELLGYKKTNYNELTGDKILSTYKQVKVVPVDTNESSSTIGLKYDGKYINSIDEKIYGPFKAPIDLDKIELEIEYKELIIEDFNY